MNLLDLSPRWLKNENDRRWLLFKNPTGGDCWLTCKNFPMSVHDQMEGVYKLAPDLKGQLIVCVRDYNWTIKGELANLTVHPSIDASASGNWHGFIVNGQVTNA